MSQSIGPQIVILASGNSGKLAEFSRLLEPLNMELKFQSEFQTPEVPEDGLSFIENAIIKARAAAKHTGHPALADDSAEKNRISHRAQASQKLLEALRGR